MVSAQVGEWLKPADCKSAPPSGVRRFESFPVHQDFCEAIGGGVRSVRGPGGTGVEHAPRSAHPGGNAGNSGIVCSEDVAASQRIVTTAGRVKAISPRAGSGTKIFEPM